MKFDVHALCGGYAKKRVFQNISFSVKDGQMTYVLGANGCGKTTLFKIMIGYKQRISGNITADEIDIRQMTHREMAKTVAFIPQQHVPVFHYSVRDVVVMGRAGHLPSFAAPRSVDYDHVMKALNMLGIVDLADTEYTRISGGQQQMVLIARAICQQAKIIVLDEPLQSLDFVNQSMVTRTLKKLVKNGYAVVMSTHTAIHNYDAGDKALLMDKNGGTEFGSIDDVLTKPKIAKAYGIPIETIKGEDGRGGRHMLFVPEEE